MRQPRPRATSRATIAGLALFGVLVAGLLFSSPLALAALPEAPVTKEAIPIKGTTATLHGEVNPGVSAEEVEYDFAYSSGALCTEGGAVIPVSPGKVAGNHKEVPATAVTGLEGSTEYTFCLLATNISGSRTGSQLKFKTLAEKPVVVIESSSSLTPFDAVLGAEINPEKQASTYHFEYATNPALTGATSIGAGEVPGTFGDQTASPADIGGGLKPATTYYYRVVATNATGETKGADGEFTTLTLEKPLVGSESTSAVTATAATLQAVVNPNYQATTYSFTYALNEALTEGAVTVAGVSPLAAEFAELPVSVSTGVLAPRTTYFYRAEATNETGTTEAASVEHFTTLATPVVTTGAATEPTRTTAMVSGTVNPGGVPTTVHFAYIEQAGYEAAVAENAANPYAKGRTTSESASVGSDYTVHAVGPLQVSELRPGVTYHYALVASNSVATTIDPTGATFTTSAPTPPIAVTGEAVGVTQLSATLTGAVNTQGLQTTLQFEFGTSPTPGQGSLVSASIGSESGSTVGITVSFSGSLQQGTTYYYRTVATNSDGTRYGAERSFTTGSFPGLPGAAPAQLIAWPPFVAAALAAAEPHETTSTGPPKPLTKAQKLAKALKACNHKPKRQRPSCRRQAKRRYR
jgi:phosphodiesterase/alkaline phosphatase D-like protein